jgi:hypothetical protein
MNARHAGAGRVEAPDPLATTASRRYGRWMRTRLFRCCAFWCMALADPASAEPILDQSHEGITAAASCFQGFDCAQSFTVGVSGILVRAEVMLSRQPSPTVDVVDLDLRALGPGGVPVDAAPIALTSSVSTNDLSSGPEWIAFEFGGEGVPVIAGESFALVVRAPFLAFPDGIGWAGSVGSDGYAGGDGWRKVDAQPFEPQPGGFDGNFQTWVEVPEPDPTHIGGGAAAVLASLARARRRRPVSVARGRSSSSPLPRAHRS